MGDQRYPANVRIIGVMHKDANKMFMTSVLWSDQGEVIVYRSFQDFKKLHKQLKKKFPVENPFRKRDRVLPRFRARVMKRNFQKGPSKSVHRVKVLEKYCTELLQCDPSVTKSAEVMQFFLPQDHDLQPEFTKNSVMILLSEDMPDSQWGGDLHSKRLSVGNVTQPFVTKTYCCVAPYETKDTKNRAFKVVVNETLDVLIKDQAGWWLVENDEKRLAWFPAPYLEKCEEEEEEDDFDDAPVKGVLYCATRSYTSMKGDEVSVKIGAVVEVLQKSDDGWWLIRYNRKAGYVPSMYLRPYTNPYAGLQTLHQKLYASTLNLSPSAPLRYESGLQPRSLHKSRSLDLLSEPRQQRDAPEEEPDSRKGRLIRASAETDYSFSSSSSDSPSLAHSTSSTEGDEDLEPRGRRPGPDSGLSCNGSDASRSSSKTGAAAPKVPPRPQAQEILTRCTTYTRKAALASRARLFPEPGWQVQAC